MSRPSGLTKKAEAEIERLTLEGWGSRRIAKELERLGIRATDRSTVSRHQIGRFQRKLRESLPEPIEPSEPDPDGVGEDAPAPAEIVHASPSRAPAPTSLPGIRTDTGAPSTTRIERISAIRWLRSLLAVEIPLIVERLEDGGARLRRCTPDDPCGLPDTRRLDHFSRSIVRLDRVLKHAEEEGIGSRRGELLGIQIDLRGGGPDPGGDEGSTTSGLLSPDLIGLLEEYLAMRGGSYDDFLDFVAGRLE